MRRAIYGQLGGLSVSDTYVTRTRSHTYTQTDRHNTHTGAARVCQVHRNSTFFFDRVNPLCNVFSSFSASYLLLPSSSSSLFSSSSSSSSSPHPVTRVNTRMDARILKQILNHKPETLNFKPYTLTQVNTRKDARIARSRAPAYVEFTCPLRPPLDEFTCALLPSLERRGTIGKCRDREECGKDNEGGAELRQVYEAVDIFVTILLWACSRANS